MSALPIYQVEFIPLERRLGDRRVAARDAAIPSTVKADRRQTVGRRAGDRPHAMLKAV